MKTTETFEDTVTIPLGKIPWRQEFYKTFCQICRYESTGLAGDVFPCTICVRQLRASEFEPYFSHK